MSVEKTCTQKYGGAQLDNIQRKITLTKMSKKITLAGTAQGDLCVGIPTQLLLVIIILFPFFCACDFSEMAQ
jgi:hypothetical protein